MNNIIRESENKNFLLEKKYNNQLLKHSFYKFKKTGPSFYIITIVKLDIIEDAYKTVIIVKK
jgi:hypothetical protein